MLFISDVSSISATKQWLATEQNARLSGLILLGGQMVVSATTANCFARERGNTGDLIKHLRITHKIDINPCTIFNVKKPKVYLDSDPQVESGDSDVSDKKGTCTFFNFYETLTLSIRHELFISIEST